jgi:hypothetical protein
MTATLEEVQESVAHLIAALRATIQACEVHNAILQNMDARVSTLEARVKFLEEMLTGEPEA